MDYVEFGKTGLVVSKLCFGTLTLNQWQANLSLKEGSFLLREGLERGINFFDTAQIYSTYHFIREALKGFSGNVVIASKSFAYDKKTMAESLEEALALLNRDSIEIFMLHEQESDLTLKGHSQALEYLVKAKEKGYVRAIGLSTHYISGVKAALSCGQIDVVMAIINKSGLGIMDGSAKEMLSALEEASQKGIGVYAMKAFGGGHLREDSFKFVLSQPFIHSVAVGMKSQEELLMNVLLTEGKEVPLSLTEKVKCQLRRLVIEDCQGCGKCIERCPSKALHLENSTTFVDPKRCILCSYCASVCPYFCLSIV